MFRRNPDAVAILVVGLFLLIANAPRMIIDSAPHFGIRPLTVQVPHQEIRAERDRVREEIRREVQAHREAVKAAIEEARSEVQDAIRK